MKVEKYLSRGKLSFYMTDEYYCLCDVAVVSLRFDEVDKDTGSVHFKISEAMKTYFYF